MSRAGTFATAAAKRRAGRIARGADFRVDYHGSVNVLTALTQAAIDWVEAHLPDDRQTWGRNGTVVESRYLAPIFAGIDEAGLTIRS